MGGLTSPPHDLSLWCQMTFTMIYRYGVRESYEKFKRVGAEVIGINGDSPESHKAFAKKYRFPFTLLSDEGNKLRKEWGVPGDFFGSLPGRETYVIDKKGVVQLVYNNQFQPEKHVDETLKMLQSL
jgi:peroxiredoxin Q/BCP